MLGLIWAHTSFYRVRIEGSSIIRYASPLCKNVWPAGDETSVIRLDAHLFPQPFTAETKRDAEPFVFLRPPSFGTFENQRRPMLPLSLSSGFSGRCVGA